MKDTNIFALLWSEHSTLNINSTSSFLVFRDVVHGVMYTYQVQTISRWGDSEPSPPLFHRLGAPYCGDGIIQRCVYVTDLQFHHYHQALNPNINDDHMHAALY